MGGAGPQVRVTLLVAAPPALGLGLAQLHLTWSPQVPGREQSVIRKLPLRGPGTSQQSFCQVHAGQSPAPGPAPPQPLLAPPRPGPGPAHRAAWSWA